jgi:hypothetical protein
MVSLLAQPCTLGSWSSLCSRATDRVVEVADAPIPEMELWREIKLNRHARKRQGGPEVSPKDACYRVAFHTDLPTPLPD